MPAEQPESVVVLDCEYRKTATIRARQWFKDGDHPAVIRKSDPNRYADEGVPWVETLEGGHVVTPGDWIATGVQGEHWPIKPDVFAATYALVTPSDEDGGGAWRNAQTDWTDPKNLDRLYREYDDRRTSDPVSVHTARLHPKTTELVNSFAIALAHKLLAAEEKYGYSDGWLTDDWEAKCQADLLDHVYKGDPLDVAAYAAFCWARNWPSSAAPRQPQGAEVVEGLVDYLQNQASEATTEEGRAILLEWAAAVNATPQPVQPAPVGREPDEATEQALRSRAKKWILSNGWKASDKVHMQGVLELCTMFAMDVTANPEAERCGYPECGCDFDAVCNAALSQPAPEAGEVG